MAAWSVLLRVVAVAALLDGAAAARKRTPVPVDVVAEPSSLLSRHSKDAEAAADSWTPSIGLIKAPCNGNAEFPSVPMCFRGEETLIGLKTEILINLLSYSDGRGVGEYAFHGDQEEGCKDVSFTKSGQDLFLDIGHCRNPNGVSLTFQYCSDTESLAITAKYPPLPMVSISFYVHRVPCQTSLAEAQPADAGALVEAKGAADRWSPSIGIIKARCDGTADLPQSPICFRAQETLIGLKTEILVSLRSDAAGRGMGEYAFHGDQEEGCKDVSWTKSGQELVLDTEHCRNPNGITFTMKYCSDTETLSVEAKYPPLPLVGISFTLHKTECAQSLAEASPVDAGALVEAKEEVEKLANALQQHAGVVRAAADALNTQMDVTLAKKNLGNPRDCPGDGDLPASSMCFRGDENPCLAGQCKQFGVTVRLHHEGGGRGTADIYVDGAFSARCEGVSFSKSGRPLNIDYGSCPGTGDIRMDPWYCSDSGKIESWIVYTPMDLGIPVTLNPVAC